MESRGELGLRVTEGDGECPLPRRLETDMGRGVVEAEVSGRGEGSGSSIVIDRLPMEEKDERRGEVSRSLTIVMEERRSLLISLEERRSSIVGGLEVEVVF